MAQAGAAGSGGCDQQAEAEDRATMGIDAGGRAQHRRFGGDAAPAQGIEVRPGCTEVGHGSEIVAQREQAAQECAGVHGVMAAGVEGSEQPGLGRQRQFRVQAGDGQTPQARAVRGSCRPDRRRRRGA
ncbi:hypothetical protein G6F60_014556 [Rhizopus arrhizus]|nr:hypothetical protein G6F60_014556 [Rhizopus arrhizus]